jgi:hypothetical protein
MLEPVAYRGVVYLPIDAGVILSWREAREFALFVLLSSAEAAKQSLEEIPPDDPRYSIAAEGAISRWSRTKPEGTE